MTEQRRPARRSGTSLAEVAAAVIWWQPGPAVNAIAYAALGGALARVFPALIILAVPVAASELVLTRLAPPHPRPAAAPPSRSPR